MDDDTARHNAKMAKKKAARDKIMAGKTGEKGLIIVHTGKGKGKSSAAFGMIFRAIAHGMPCAVVQFIKGAMSTGERDLILRHFGDTCQFHTMGEGFTWETQDRTRDTAMALAAKARSRPRSRVSSPSRVMVMYATGSSTVYTTEPARWTRPASPVRHPAVPIWVGVGAARMPTSLVWVRSAPGMRTMVSMGLGHARIRPEATTRSTAPQRRTTARLPGSTVAMPDMSHNPAASTAAAPSTPAVRRTA